MISTYCFFHTATGPLVMVILIVLLLHLLHVFWLLHIQKQSLSKKSSTIHLYYVITHIFNILFFSYCYWSTCYGHSNSITVTLAACLLTPAHSETISIKKIEHYSFVLCDYTYFQHIVFFILLLVHLLWSF